MCVQRPTTSGQDAVNATLVVLTADPPVPPPAPPAGSWEALIRIREAVDNALVEKYGLQFKSDFLFDGASFVEYHTGGYDVYVTFLFERTEPEGIEDMFVNKYSAFYRPTGNFQANKSLGARFTDLGELILRIDALLQEDADFMNRFNAV